MLMCTRESKSPSEPTVAPQTSDQSSWSQSIHTVLDSQMSSHMHKVSLAICNAAGTALEYHFHIYSNLETFGGNSLPLPTECNLIRQGTFSRGGTGKYDIGQNDNN